MTYVDALEYLKKVSECRSCLGLERLSILTEKLGNPQDKIKTIHASALFVLLTTIQTGDIITSLNACILTKNTA